VIDISVWGFWAVLNFEPRVLFLVGRHCTSWAMSPALFTLVIFEIESHCSSWPGPRSSQLCFLHGWDDKCAPLHPAWNGWDGGLKNCLPGLALSLDPPHLYLLSSWDYRCESLHLANISGF
jgi:hypothetical protein